MRTREIKDSDIMRIAIQQESVRSEESRYDHRPHGVLLVCSGFSCYKGADIFGGSPPNHSLQGSQLGTKWLCRT